MTLGEFWKTRSFNIKVSRFTDFLYIISTNAPNTEFIPIQKVMDKIENKYENKITFKTIK